MEVLRYRKSTSLVAAAVSTLALSSCSVDSYHTDASAVHCDGERTKAELEDDGVATFIVHGEKDRIATVTVRREDDFASVKVEGDIEGRPPQEIAADGFSEPVEIVSGSELSTFGGGGAWLIDVRKDSVVIQGNCDGM